MRRSPRAALGPLILALVVGCLLPVAAQAERVPTQRWATTAHGSVTSAGNTVVTCRSSDPGCPALQAGTIPDSAGPAARVWTDVDSASTFNSSRSTLTVPTGATILKAYLYWGGSTVAGGGLGAQPAPNPALRNAIQINPPSAGGYQTITAGWLDDLGNGSYAAGADVTSLIAAERSGGYNVADIQTGTGIGAAGGWSLVVVLGQASAPLRRLQVLDGLTYMSPPARTSVDIALSDFTTPAAGPVTGRMIMVGGDGTRGEADQVTLNGAAIGGGGSPDDTLNSSGGGGKDPNVENLTGIELEDLSIGGLIGNAATSTTLHLASTVDDFYVAAVALATDEGPPQNATAPAISGKARDTQTLTGTLGTWRATPTVTYATQWRRCDGSGANCAAIAGATGSTLTLTPTDVGSTFRYDVTASNAAGTGFASSALTAPVVADPPAATTLPTISGTAQDTARMTVTRGAWTGTPTLSYAFQWQRCDVGGGTCQNITGETGATYDQTPADVGSRIRVVVTATNGGGSTSAASAASATVAPDPATNVTAPVISGIATDGEVLLANRGTWTGTQTLTYAYQWQRCNASGASCADIPGATTFSQTLAPADVGATLRVRVTATNAAGPTVATSAVTGVIAPDPPAASSAPTVWAPDGARDGKVLTADRGVWTGTPTVSYAYQWQRCAADGTGCASIAGSTSTSHQLTPADVDMTLRVRVTATNAAGPTAATSAPSAKVAPAPPAVTGNPTLSGAERDTQTLTATSGTWTGTPAITYAYRWRRCDADGSACADIDGATASSYALTPDDVGATIRVQVTATNAGGSATATSPASRAVAPDPAAPGATPPSVGGTPMHEATLTAGEGTWSGTPDLTFTYQWGRCDAGGAGCADITGATGATYEPVDADIGQTLRVLVTATNAGGAESALSAPSAAVLPASPANTSAPTTSLERSFGGQALVADRGTWSGTRPMDHDFRWERCDADGRGCATVAGAKQKRYRIAEADSGNRLRVIVTARNVAGDAVAASAISGVVESPPAVQPDPDPTPDPTPKPDPTPTPAPPPTASTPAPSPAADAPQPPLTSSVPVQPAARPPAAEPAHTPAPAAAPASLGALPGSLIAPTTCQTLTSGAGIVRTDLPESGPVRLRIRSDAILTLAAPMTIRLTAVRLNRLRIRLALDGRPLRATVTASEQHLTLSPSALVKAADHRLTVELIRPNGGGRRLTVPFRTAPCKARFTSAFYRTRSGTGLRLRMDSDRALGSVGFTVPAPLALHGEGAPRLAGRLRYVVAPGRSKIVKLTLPGKGTSGTLLAGGANGPTVRFDAKGFSVEGLPAGTGIAELTLFGRQPKQAAAASSYVFGARPTPRA